MALVTSKEMFAKAYDGGYAIGAFNVNNMEIVQGITEACQEEHAPVILQVSKGARAYANHTYLVKLVEAAVACGTPHWKIILRHVLPNCFGPILVDVLMSVAGTIMAASSLSFLGMGIQVPAPEWGAMLSQATKYLQSQPYLAIFPGMAILVTSLTFNLIGDGLTDALDPKNR